MGDKSHKETLDSFITHRMHCREGLKEKAIRKGRQAIHARYKSSTNGEIVYRHLLDHNFEKLREQPVSNNILSD